MNVGSRNAAAVRPSDAQALASPAPISRPPGTDLFGDHVALVRVKASHEFLIPLLETINIPMPKRDLYLLAAKMRAAEIHPDVREKLDRIAAELNPTEMVTKRSL